MRTRVALVSAAVAVATYGTALAVDNPIPAKVGVVKTMKLTKFVSKSATGFPLPSGPSQDPTITGAQIVFFDTGGAGGIFLHSLPASGWKGLGNPAGSKGYKYKGKNAGDTTCKVILRQLLSI